MIPNQMIVNDLFIQMSVTITTLVAWNKYVNKVFDTRIYCFVVVKGEKKLFLFK